MDTLIPKAAITGIQKGLNQRRRQDVEVEDGEILATSQGMWQPLEQENKETDPLSFQKKQTCQHLDLIPLRSISEF